MMRRICQQWTRPVGRRALLACGLGLAAAATLRPAQAAASYLDGETLRVLLPNSAGSAMDRAARLFCEHLGRRLPSTLLSVQNVLEANGRLALLQAFQAAPDGLTLVFPTTNHIYSEILGDEGLPFSLLDFEWIGGLSQEHRLLLLSAKSRTRDLAGVLSGDRPLLLAADGTNSGAYVQALLLNALLGTWIRPVTGYNNAARTLALMNGEVDCLLGTIEAMRPLIESGAGHPVIAFGLPSDNPLLAGVPLLESLPTDPRGRPILDLLQLQAVFGRTLATTPAVPADRLAVLRSLFTEVLADPDFLAASEAMGLPIEHTPGEALREQLGGVLADRAGLAAALAAARDCGQRRADTGERC